MMHKQRIWDIKEYNKEKASCFAAELGISPLVTGILLERGMNSIDAMRDFLYGSAQPFHDPFLLKDMQRSVERITRALAAGEKLTVYGDYDVDGITASSLLYLYLKGRGAQVQTYIPQRKSEGYGLNDEALRTIAVCMRCSRRRSALILSLPTTILCRRSCRLLMRLSTPSSRTAPIRSRS